MVDPPFGKQTQTPNIAKDAKISENELNGSLHCTGIKAEIKGLSVLYFSFVFDNVLFFVLGFEDLCIAHNEWRILVIVEKK